MIGYVTLEMNRVKPTMQDGRVPGCEVPTFSKNTSD